jgi:hypothetical protein
LDRRQHAVEIVDHLVVPESQHTIAMDVQNARPFLVLGGAYDMLPAIEFDDQTMGDTRKIDDVRADRHLAAKLCAIYPTVAQRMPQFLLGSCLIAPQSPRTDH